MNPVDLYNTSYSQYARQTYADIRQETYGLDLGQTGWMTAEELQKCFELLELTSHSQVLEVGCGAGGCAVNLAQTVGAAVTGIDINENGIRNARMLADSAKLSSRLRFERVDGAEPLPFSDQSFDAIFSNDAMCHIPDRIFVLREWQRVLKPGGRMLFTDAMVITGVMSNEEIAIRSSIGFYLFLPPGENERMITEAGMTLVAANDLTTSVERISERWHSARDRRRAELIQFESEDNFLGLQRFLKCVCTVSKERRLSRFLYLASRPID